MRLRLILLMLICFVVGCDNKKVPPPKPPIDITDYTVTAKNFPEVFESVGFAQSSHPVEIRGRVEGFLDTIAYTEGSLVQEGDLLFQLDPKQYQAKVEEAKGQVARQEALVANGKLTVNRLQPLYEQKAASKKDLDNAIAQLQSNEALLLTARASLLEADINLGYTTIKSPITGLSDKARYREGALITPGSQGLLTTVSVVDPIWVYFTVSDNDTLRFTQQTIDKTIIVPQADKLVVDAVLGDGTVFPQKGKVDFSSPTYDQSTGTLLARAVFSNPNPDLMRPGQFVRIKVHGVTRPNSLVVPRRALVQGQHGMYVYLIKDKKVIQQDISTGHWDGDYQVVTEGLKVGDLIVVDGTNKVQSGATVNVLRAWAPSKDVSKSNGK